MSTWQGAPKRHWHFDKPMPAWFGWLTRVGLVLLLVAVARDWSAGFPDHGAISRDTWVLLFLGWLVLRAALSARRVDEDSAA